MTKLISNLSENSEELNHPRGLLVRDDVTGGTSSVDAAVALEFCILELHIILPDRRLLPQDLEFSGGLPIDVRKSKRKAISCQ